MNRPLFLVLMMATALLARAQDSKLVRDGAFWVSTATGTVPVVPGGKLHVSTRGIVTVRGAGDDPPRYTLTKKVKARSEGEARRLMGQFLVRTSRQGDTGFLTVSHGGDGLGSASLEVSAPRSLRGVLIDTHGGRLEASDLNGSLDAQSRGGAIQLDRIDGPVLAKTAGGEIVLGTVGGTARCVSAGGAIRADVIRGDAWLETAGGDISVREVGGVLHASTAGGGIRIGRAGSKVALNTAGGTIEVGSAKGMVTAGNQGGPIQVGGAAGVQCDSGGGAIRLSNVSGSMNASTLVGNIMAQLLTGAVLEDSILSTGGGDITVLVPSNLRITILAQMELASNARRIVSEFPAVKTRMEGALAVAEGSINGGGPLLRLKGSGGTIYIRRQR